MTNLSMLFAFWLFLTLGCGQYKSIGDSDPPRVERGRLKFEKFVTNLVVGPEPIYHDVEQYLFVNGKKWSPEGESDFASKLNWCDTSPNPKVEMLRCISGASEDYKYTYIFRMRNDQPEIQKIDEGLPNIWINDDGRWLLFNNFYLNVETGEKIDIKIIPFNGGKETDIYPLIVVSVSPDMKTIVELPDNMTKKEGAEEFLTLWIIDTETGKVVERKVSYTKNPWLTDHKNPDNDIQPPPAPSKHFVWKRGEDGKDKMIVPELLGKVER